MTTEEAQHIIAELRRQGLTAYPRIIGNGETIVIIYDWRLRDVFLWSIQDFDKFIAGALFEKIHAE